MTMKREKNRIQGTGRVYRFTLVQLFKNRANQATLFLLFLFALAAVPAVSLLGGGGAKEAVPYTVAIKSLEEWQHPELLSSGARFVLQYGYSILVLMLVTISASYIVRSVVEEKSSRLVEYLMVSVKPLALILGKILAMMTFITAMFVLMLGGVFLSYAVSSRVLDTGAVTRLLEQAGLGSFSLSLPLLLIAAVSLLLGYLLFSILAGICGAACSNMEEVEGAATQIVILSLVGYLVPILCGSTVSKAGAVFLSLCPVVSVFSAPVQYAAGTIGLPVLLLSWGLQLLLIALLALFTAKIYGGLLMYRGKKLRLQDLLKKGGV